MAKSYVDQLVLELRNRDLPGARIGEVVAEVEAYVADSGDDPAEQFGPVADYARQVSGAVAVPPRSRLSWWTWAQCAGTGAGGILLMDGVLGLMQGRTATLTPGKMAAVAVLPVAAVVGVRVLGRASRPAESRVARAVREWVAPFGYLMAVFGLLGLLTWLLREPVLAQLSAGWAALAGGALMVLLLAVPVGLNRGDPVIDPRTGRDRYGSTARRLVWAAMLGLVVLQVAAVGLLIALTP